MPVARFLRAPRPLSTPAAGPAGRPSLAGLLGVAVLGAALGAFGCKGEGETTADGAELSPTPTAAASPGATAGDQALPVDTLAPPPGPPFDPQTLPAVVARVDGQEIARADVLERAQAMRAQMAQMGAPPPPNDQGFYRELVDQLIGAHLLYAEAKRQNLGPTPAEVQAGIAQLKSRFPSEEEFRKRMAEQGTTDEQIASEVERTMAVQRLTAKLQEGIAPTDAEMRAFYQENVDKMKRPPQVRVRHILVGTERGATPEQRQAARAEADQVLQQIRGGGDFATLAQQHSDDTGSKAEGGLLPWLGRGETVPPFDQAAFSLQPGQMSEVVESQFGFHILRLEEKRGETTVPYEEAQPQIAEHLGRRKSREAVRARVQALRQAASVEVLF
jgi:peptidyl-prolyl cis-trans isomerase C